MLPVCGGAYPGCAYPYLKFGDGQASGGCKGTRNMWYSSRPDYIGRKKHHFYADVGDLEWGSDLLGTRKDLPILEEKIERVQAFHGKNKYIILGSNQYCWGQIVSTLENLHGEQSEKTFGCQISFSREGDSGEKIQVVMIRTEYCW